MAKDQLARGARSASYGYAGRPDEAIELRNVSNEPRDVEGEAAITAEAAATKAPLRKFTPAGHQILVRQAAVEGDGKRFTDQLSALKDKSSKVVIIESEEEKKADAPAEGTVLATGPGSEDYDMTVSPGDYIVFGKYSGAAFKLNGEWLLLMGVNEVLGTLSDVTVEEEIEETFDALDELKYPVRVVSEA
jgi:chaperonin GroES